MLQLILFSNFSRLVTKHVVLKAELPLAFVKTKSQLLTFARWRHFADDEFEVHGIDVFTINRC